MIIAFKLLENDDVKTHYIFSNILYTTVDKVFPNSSMNTALAKFHYGKCMKDYSSNYSLSLNLFLESLKLIEKADQEDSKIGLQVKFFLGSLYDDMGMVEESITTLREVLKKQIEIYTEENIFTARTYNCLGISEDNRANLRQAKEYYQKAYGIFKHLSYGQETIDSVKVLNNIAGIYYKWEDYGNCVKYYLKVLEVYLAKFNENYIYVAMTYNNLGNCYIMLDNSDKALYYLKKSLAIFKQNLGDSHPQTAMTFKNLGDVYLNIKDSKNALEMYNNCINTFLEKFGEDNDLYISTLSKIKKLKH